MILLIKTVKMGFILLKKNQVKILNITAFFLIKQCLHA